MASLKLEVFRVSVTEFEKNTDGVLESLLRKTRRLVNEKNENEEQK